MISIGGSGHQRRAIGRVSGPINRYVTLAPIGAYAGFFGPGTGQLLTAALTLTSCPDPNRIHHTRRQISLDTSIAAAVILTVAAPVPWPLVLVLAPCALIGGLTGTRIARHYSEPTLRWSSVGVGVFSSVWLWLGRTRREGDDIGRAGHHGHRR